MPSFPSFQQIIALAGCLLLAILHRPLAADTSRTTWLYQETTGSRAKNFAWRHSSVGEEEVITVIEESGVFVNRCDRSGRTISWKFRLGTATDIEAERHGNELKITGTLEGRPKESSHVLDGRPWYQPLSFSLRSFLRTDEPEIVFWTIRSDTLDVVTMRAKKKGMEELEVAGRRIPAIRVEIRRDGLLSSFWHGTFWFRQDDLQFVRYQGVHGPPGTSETVVQLQGEQHRR